MSKYTYNRFLTDRRTDHVDCDFFSKAEVATETLRGQQVAATRVLVAAVVIRVVGVAVATRVVEVVVVTRVAVPVVATRVVVAVVVITRAKAVAGIRAVAKMAMVVARSHMHLVAVADTNKTPRHRATSSKLHRRIITNKHSSSNNLTISSKLIQVMVTTSNNQLLLVTRSRATLDTSNNTNRTINNQVIPLDILSEAISFWGRF